MISICKLEAGSLNPSVFITENIAAKASFSCSLWLINSLVEQILFEFITFFKHPGLPTHRIGPWRARNIQSIVHVPLY